VDGRDKPGHDEERLVVPVLRQHQPERLRQIRHLRRRELARVQPAQQQIEFRCLFQRGTRGWMEQSRTHRLQFGEMMGCATMRLLIDPKLLEGQMLSPRG
jgi:hypothetical protein